MTTKVYVTDPRFSVPDPNPDFALLCYSVIVWEEGLPPVQHAPCQEQTIVSVAFGEAGPAIQQKIIDNISARLGVGSNDIIFLGSWV